MNIIKINYIFSIGFRCNSTDFFTRYKLRHISGPFDYTFIDIETSFENIYNKFKFFLNNIVFLNKNENILKIYYSNNEISQKIVNLKNQEKINYMKHNYNNNNLLINQNFINNTPSNLYNWDRICIFLHHAIYKENKYIEIKSRSNIFNNIYETYPNNLCLFYLTKIIEVDDFNSYKNYIINLKKIYNIKCYIIIIVCSDRLNESHCFENNILFIIKRVNDYNSQYYNRSRDKNLNGTDNNFGFREKNNIMLDIFVFELKTKIKIKKHFNG